MTSTRTKRQKIHFEQCRKCKNHETIVAKYNVDPHRLYTVGSKDYSRKSYNYLVSKYLLTNRCKYVCNNCLKHATDHLSEETGKEMPSNGHYSLDDTEDLLTDPAESMIKSIDKLMKQLQEAENSSVSDKLKNTIKSSTHLRTCSNRFR